MDGFGTLKRTSLGLKNNKFIFGLVQATCLLTFFFIGIVSAHANVPGGGTGTGANVTVTDNGGTVVLANGIVSLTINKASGTITNFTYNGTNLLAGGSGGGSFYFDNSGGPTLANTVYTLTVNPANNGGNQAEVWLQSTASPMDMAVYYDLLRGQQGIYDTLILTHQASYADYPGAELRTNMYVGSIFDWLCVDPYRFRQMAPPSTAVTTVAGAPPEVMQYTAGIYNGLTNCKYSYSSPLGQIDTWGWASSTSKYGVWQTLPSHEFEDGGPMHRELTEHIGNTLLNMVGGGHYGFGLSQDQPAGSFSSKTFGPAFIYANQYTGAASDPVSLKARVLWADAQAQAQAEQSAWPYTWFNPQPVTGATGTVYPQASGRGTVGGTLAINDANNPGTSPVSLWIGLAPVDGGIDFQQQYLTYQFWVKTGAGGSFSIPNVVPGTYNLWAFGPGVVGTFEKANVTVAAGQALALGTLTWSPLRLGPTVWDIGIPDRNSNEFNNGEHDVTPYSGTLPGYAGGPPFDTPTDWGAFMDYTNQYPNGVSFVVGTSNYANDWDYVQPTVPSGTSFAGSTSKIFFNLSTAPTAAQTARLYIAFAAVNSGACILTINGTVQTASVMGSTDGTYAAITNPTTGFFPPNHSFDTPLRLGSQGAWGDAYLDFAGNKLKAGMNEIDIGMRPTGGASLGQGFEYDYVRLELTGYSTTVTPTPTPAAATATRTPSPTASPTRTASSTATKTLTPTSTTTQTPTMTFSPTMTTTKTMTPTATVTKTMTSTLTATPSTTQTPTKMASSTATVTSTPSFTRTPTDTVTLTVSSTATKSPTQTSTATQTPSLTATPVLSPTPTPTASLTQTLVPSATITPTFTVTQTPSLTSSPTTTSTPSLTATFTRTPSSTATSSFTSTPTMTETPTASATATATKTATVTPTFSPTHTPVFTETPTASFTPTLSPTQTLSGTSTPTVALSLTATPTFGQGVPITTPIPFPNPVSGPTVTISFNLRDNSPWVHIEIFTTAFRKVNEINLTHVPAGAQLVTIPLTDGHGSPLANGIYYILVVNQQGRAIGKLLVLR
jgi:rhamnogalacturonan endolyase